MHDHILNYSSWLYSFKLGSTICWLVPINADISVSITLQHNYELSVSVAVGVPSVNCTHRDSILLHFVWSKHGMGRKIQLEQRLSVVSECCSVRHRSPSDEGITSQQLGVLSSQALHCTLSPGNISYEGRCFPTAQAPFPGVVHIP